MELQALAFSGVLAGDLDLVVLEAELLTVGNHLEVDVVFLYATLSHTLEGDVADVLDLQLDLAGCGAQGGSLDVQSISKERC